MRRLRRILGLIAILFGGQCPSSCRAIDETAMQETSGAYLRNVVNELQILNGIVPSEAGGAPDRQSYVYGAPTPTSAPVRFAERQTPSIPRYDLQPQVLPQNPTCLDDAPKPSPMILGFTPAELASMYRKAIERGAPIKYNSLVNTINYQTPKIIGPQFEISQPHPEESQYAYYFYPLQTFRHELMNHYGYRTVPDFKYDLAPAENTKKETSTMNPILVGISSFLGIALAFMVSLLFYPRFMHYMNFPFVTTSRKSFENELMHLTSFVTEAIDYYRNNVQKNYKNSSSTVRMKKFQRKQVVKSVS